VELLERRYRWLLACYPAPYRAAFADEMLGVALAGAAPGQRRPGLGEAASLVAGGLWRRGGTLLAGSRGPAWGDAGAAFTLLGAVLLAAINAERVTGSLASSAIGEPERLRPSALVLAAGWVLVTVAVGLGRRRVAAVAASLAAAGEVVVLAAGYAGNPSALVTSWWQLMLAVTAALAAIVARSGATAPRRLLGRSAALGVLASVVLAVAGPAISAAFTTITPLGGGAAMASSPLNGVAGFLRYGLFALLTVTVLAAVISIGPAARRRVMLMALPAGSAAAIVAWGFGGFLVASPRFTPPVLLTAPQWAVLAAVPLLSFAAGVAWLGRYERMLRLTAEGRQAPV
jgi:hypothetical protein